jgi:uncharacterized Tic20 family protein
VETETKNYGTVGEADFATVDSAVDPMADPTTAIGAGNERTWSALAHLSTLLNVFTVFLGPVAALGVWLYYRDRSRAVAFQALQSAVYQGAWILALATGWAITFLLMAVLVGFLLVLPMALLTLVPIAHAVYAAYRVSKGEAYRYPIVADMIERR